MKEKLKGALVAFLLTGVMVIFASTAKASTAKVTFVDAYLAFEVWQGSGTSAISIGDDSLTKDLDIVKFEEFEQLQYNGKAVDVSNYMLMESGRNTIITLKEEYLKTLADGTYSFDAVFARAVIPVRLHVVTHKVTLADAYFTFSPWNGSGSAQVGLKPDTFSYAFYPELFLGLQYKGKKVESSNYSISQFANVTKIILKEEYIKTLPDGEHYFTADFMNISILLKLKKETMKNTTKELENTIKPKKVKKVKLISKKRKLKVTWKKQNKVTGYVIKVGTNKNITKNKKEVTVKKNKGSVTMKGLKANRRYYLKVRSYIKSDGKTYWGTWSKTVSGKTKNKNK